MNGKPAEKLYLTHSLSFIISVYITGILFFLLIRGILCITHYTAFIQVPLPILFKSCWMGWRFDTVISTYILAIPLLTLITGTYIPIRRRKIKQFCLLWITAFYALALVISAIDLVYFGYYHTRITVDMLKWMNTPGIVLKMVFQDWRNCMVLSLLIVALILLYRGFRYWSSRYLDENWSITTATKGRRKFYFNLYYLLIIGIAFLGMRGRLSPKSPIRWGTAFFSDYTFANQLGLNPVYTFIQSYIDSRNPKNRHLNLMADTTAIAYMNQFMNIPIQQDTDPGSASPSNLPPLTRQIRPQDSPHNWNVVLVLMESMAAWKMGAFGNPDHLTPHLDSIAQQGWLFTRFYSDGSHTCNGIFATLFGYPTLMSKHPLKSTDNMQFFGGIPHLLNRRGYQSVFFCTHDEQFDNLGGFLSHNGFQKIISQRDYPRSDVINTFGVPDGVMFDHAIPYLRQLHQNRKPFLAVLLTDSDHSPYTIPEPPEFKPHSNSKAQKATEYADWAIGRFMRQATQEEWFATTIFLFTADHGQYIQSPFDISLGLHHIPLIIYPREKCEFPDPTALGSQVDVLPTLMGILKIPYQHNTMGYNLARDRHSMVIFNDDNKLSCLNDSLLWVSRMRQGWSLYRYLQEDNRDYAAQYPNQAAAMRDFAHAQLQAVQWLINQRKINVDTLP